MKVSLYFFLLLNIIACTAAQQKDLPEVLKSELRLPTDIKNIILSYLRKEVELWNHCIYERITHLGFTSDNSLFFCTRPSTAIHQQIRMYQKIPYVIPICEVMRGISSKEKLELARENFGVQLSDTIQDTSDLSCECIPVNFPLKKGIVVYSNDNVLKAVSGADHARNGIIGNNFGRITLYNMIKYSPIAHKHNSPPTPAPPVKKGPASCHCIVS